MNKRNVEFSLDDLLANWTRLWCRREECRVEDVTLIEGRSPLVSDWYRVYMGVSLDVNQRLHKRINHSDWYLTPQS